MRVMKLRGVMVLLLLVFASAVIAKEAAPLAADPQLEKRVNKITAELRCLVCQNQTIADSHAGLAIDLKNQVRDMVRSGQTQDQIVDYMVQRYGDFVLYRPPVKKTTYLLWTGPFLLLAIGLTVLVVTLRKRRVVVQDDAPLSAEENERLRSMLQSDAQGQEGKKNKNEGGKS
jgi:cytochrome c-type biogenesis protein CcmH